MSAAPAQAPPDDTLALERLPPRLLADWRALAASTPNPEPFDAGMLAGLPAPARRWLAHAIAPGTPLHRAAVFAQHGQIKVGRWQSFVADWVLAPPDGFIWVARTRLGPLSIRGFDRFTGGAGEMRWRLFGRIPFMAMTGSDVTRSALGRLVGEMCFVPAAALDPGVHWEEVDDRQAVACVDVQGRPHRVTLTVAPSGALERVDVPRWGNPDGRGFREHLFTAVLDPAEAAFDGFTIPVRARAGWWHCPDGCAPEEFFRLSIEHASFR